MLSIRAQSLARLWVNVILIERCSVGLLFSLYEISDLSGSMKGQNFIGKVIKVAAVVVEKKEGGIDVGS